jgi:mitotic spindle assembly checkpoint protein MAD2B
MESTELTFDQTLEIILEFIQAAIHYILYIRAVYPSTIFKKTKIYNVPIRQSTYPALNNYINSLLQTIKPDLKLGKLNKLYICLKKNQLTVEKYTFQIIAIADGLKSLPSEELECYLRAFFLKLSCLDSHLTPIPSGSEWAAYVELTNQDSFLNSDELIPAQGKEIKVEKGRLLPLRTVNTGLMKLELFVEETVTKNEY